MINRNTDSNNQLRRPKKSFRQPKIFSGRKIRSREWPAFPPKLYKPAALAVVFAAIIYLFFFSSLFAVKDIIVEGNKFVPSSEIIDTLSKNENIFRFNFKENKEDLMQKYPEIKDLVFYRGIPNAVKVAVLERDAQIIWQSGEERFLLSSQGEVARKTGSEEGIDLPRVIDRQGVPVKVGAPLVSPNFINFISNVYSSFYDTTNVKPAFFEITETTFDVILQTEAGFAVKLNTLRPSKTQLENLKSILVERRSDIHEYVDLRIDGWAYYK